MASIDVKNIVKEYGDGFLAVKGISLDIADGEFMILVGPSGCGKSTLLRMIVGLEDITGGDLFIGGERMNEKAPRDRNLAMVFQNYALYPHLTVRENIAFPLRLHRGEFSDEEIRSRVERASAMLELDDHLDRKPANLSGGQRQRVAMGRAIVRNAQAFLFDEPLSNLDAKLRGQMRTEIARLQRSLATTTVYVTHDQTEAMTLGDRVAVLSAGELQQVASPRALYEQPVNLFVAGFIGSPPMNFLPGELGDGKIRLPFGEFDLPDRIAQAAGDRSLVIVGIRPESFEDAKLTQPRDGSFQFEAAVDVTEWLGSELYAYVPFQTHHAVEAKLAELERQLDSEALRTQFVVNLDSASRVRDGDTATLWFDPAKMLVFDPETTENLTHDEAEATRLDEENEADRKASIERAKARAAKEGAAA